MPNHNNHKVLSQVLNYIKDLIDGKLANKSFWLKAEVCNTSIQKGAGHWYLDLVENRDGKTIAQCRATIWSHVIQQIKHELGDDFENIVKKGSEILCHVHVTFHQVYGLAVNIFEIDRYFALGELERRKQETFERLRNQQLLDKNKVHRLPLVIQNMAIIGSVGTSGHTDLIKQLETNEYNYRFNFTNFNCQVQGEKAEQEIIQRLLELQNSGFDVILLVRGGGSKLDLEVFNSYNLARAIADHAKPIITGIGHETDISIADLVANRYFKTPSAVGAFVVNRNHNFENQIKTSYQNIMTLYEVYMQRQSHRIKQALTTFQAASTSYTRLRRGTLHQTANRIFSAVRTAIAEQNEFHSVGKQIITATVATNLRNKKNRLQDITTLVGLHTEQNISTHKRKNDFSRELLVLHTRGKIKAEQDKLFNNITLLELYHPDRTLERGFSITRLNGHEIQDASGVNIGDTIDVELANTYLKAIIVSKNPKKSKWKNSITKVQQKS